MEYLAGKAANEAERWMGEAARSAESALCLRDKCGAVVVSGGVVVGRGYNAPPLDDLSQQLCAREIPPPPKQKVDRTCCVHAEWRAILDCLKHSPEKIVGASIYFTRVDAEGTILRSGKPYCTVCSRLALDVGLSEFVLWHDEGLCSYATGEYNLLSYGLEP